MKINSKFFKKLFFFTLISFISIECSIRIFKLTNDIPQREIDENGLQTYVVNQSGYFNNNLWKVNEYGFIGLKDVNNENQILIIGDSMIDIGINEGDIAIIKQKNDAKDGDLVVALINDTETTLQRFKKNGKEVVLEAENKNYKSQVYKSGSNIKIQGILSGLIRRYN